MNRFDYVKYDETSAIKQTMLKSRFKELEFLIEEMLMNGRAKSLSLTALEEAYMWVGKAIRDEQVFRTGEVELQEERNDG